MKLAGLAEIRQVRISGGGARSSLWRQILADVFQVELVMVNASEGAAYGAALLAATGTGIYPNVESACATTIHPTGSTEPGPASAVYREVYPLYMDLYPELRPTFNAMARVATLGRHDDQATRLQSRPILLARASAGQSSSRWRRRQPSSS